MSARTSASRPLTPSMAELTSRVSGMAAGSIRSPCASHSAARASASAFDGTASSRFAGVRAGLPSSSTRKAGAAPSTDTTW